MLSNKQVKVLVNQTEKNFRHEECATCECYLGYLTQLEMDADQEGQLYLKEIYPGRDEIHACLGCDPCPPGVQYAEYLQNKQHTPTWSS
jgi:hypothetical protein